MNSKTFSYVIYTAVCWTCAGAKLGRRARVPLRTIGGRDAQPGEFPYVVRMELQAVITINGAVHRTYYYHSCTGSALSATVTITAAHCCFPKKTSEILDRRNRTRVREQSMVIRYGSVPGPPVDDDRFSEVLNCLQSRPEVDNLINNDIALLITQPIVLRSYGRISARDHHTMYGYPVTIVGYGSTNASDGTLLSTLELKMPLQVIDAMWVACDRHNFYPLVCVAALCRQHGAICPGDSGGPVLLASDIVGLSSRGHVRANCQMNTDAIRDSNMGFTMPISGYVDWIADIVAKF